MLEMVECDRLGGPKSAPAKMTRVACVKRYRIANEGMDGDKSIKVSPCRGCPVGRERSAGYAIPEGEGVFPANGARVINRTCTRCGKGFRGYPASKFCAACKKVRPKVGQNPKPKSIGHSKTVIGHSKKLPAPAPERPQEAPEPEPTPEPPPPAEASGSVYQREQDGLWVASLSVGSDDDGKRRRRTAYAASEEEAQQKLAQLRAEADVGHGAREELAAMRDVVDLLQGFDGEQVCRIVNWAKEALVGQ